jgi:hypothetical protein
MNVKPKHYLGLKDQHLRTIGAEKGWVVLECEIISPPSSEGKTVYAFFDPDDVTAALLEFRDAARRARM